jgi:hypothetical protein
VTSPPSRRHQLPQPVAVNGETLFNGEIPDVWPILYFPGERNLPVNR